MTETTIRPNRFRINKPQQEEVINEVEVIEEENIQEEGEIEEVVTQPIVTKRTRTIKQEEVVKLPSVKSVVKPVNSIPKKPGLFKQRKVEKVIEVIEEDLSTIVGKDYLEVLATIYSDYLDTLTDEVEDDTPIKDIIEKGNIKLVLETLEECFNKEIFPNYDKVKFLGSVFEKKLSSKNFRKAPNTRENTYIFSEGNLKVRYNHDLENDSSRAYFNMNEEGEVESIEKVTIKGSKKEVVEITDGSLDYLIPELQKYITKQQAE